MRPDDRSHRASLVARDKRFVWHPYTPMQDYIERGEPLVIARAAGSRFFDHDGRSILDGNASWWTSLLGHNHPRLVAALKAQADDFCHVTFGGTTHAPAVECAEALCEVAPPGLGHVFFSDDGSTAVEAAIKLSVQYFFQNGAPRKRRVLSLEHAFHGETLGVTALGGVPEFRAPFAGLADWVDHVPTPAHGLDRALSVLEETLRQRAHEIAALVVEPLVQGCGGMLVYDAEYLHVARRLTEEHDVLLVADEVFTGYGRTGPFWACQAAGIVPDLLCSAKGLSGGLLPFAATLASDRVFEGFFGDRSRAFLYGHTYAGNPLGARVALEVLRVYRDERILERAAPKSARLARAFQEFGALPGVERVRSLGMCAALDLAPSARGGGYLDRAGWRVYEAALARGAYVRPLGNVVYLTPALNIPDSDLEELLGIVGDSLASVLLGEAAP